jgi:hypothetical protein
MAKKKAPKNDRGVHYFINVTGFQDGTAYAVAGDESFLVMKSGERSDGKPPISLETARRFVRRRAWKEVTQEEAETHVRISSRKFESAKALAAVDPVGEKVTG